MKTFSENQDVLTLKEKYFFACSVRILSPSSFICSSVTSPRRVGWDWNGACLTSTVGTATVSTFDMSDAETALEESFSASNEELADIIANFELDPVFSEMAHDHVCWTTGRPLYVVVVSLPPQGFRPEAKSRGGILVACVYIKDSTYGSNMQSVY